MEEYSILLRLRTDMNRNQVEEFAEEMVDEVSKNHVFPEEKLRFIFARKTFHSRLTETED